jgi:hypothetical protein
MRPRGLQGLAGVRAEEEAWEPAKATIPQIGLL